MNFKNALIFFKKSQPLIRHCWVCNIYKKKLSKRSFKEKFINLLTKDGKKSKAYKLFSETALLVRKKWLKYEKDSYFFDDQQKAIEKMISFYDRVKKKSKNSNFYITTIQRKKKVSTTGTKLNYNKKEILSFNQILVQALNNIKPVLEVRKVRVGRTTYLVPAIIPRKRQESLAIKWLIISARAKKRETKKTFAENLANEVIDSFKKQGQARQKRDELHKLAVTNRAYLRYRWW